MENEDLFRLIDEDRLDVSKLSKDQINNPDQSGWTVLTYAACAGREDIVDLLLRAGADPQIADASALRPIDYAKLYQHSETVDRLNLSL